MEYIYIFTGTKPTTFQIGTARVRNIDLDTGSDSSDVYTNASVFNLYMFDIKMFTRISGTLGGTFTTGDRVVSNSGAVAIVSHTDGNELFVHDVVGTFAVGNSITTEGVTSGTTTVTAVRSYNVDRARSITQTAKNTNREIFTADLVADSDKTLTGSLTMSSGSTAVTGFGTKYLTELKEGDIIVDQEGNENVVASVTNDLSLTLTLMVRLHLVEMQQDEELESLTKTKLLQYHHGQEIGFQHILQSLFK